ncbi:MAG: HAD family hydrolase [Planctomycetota bacterium]
MAKRQIKAVLFDLGETLLTFGRLDRSRISALAARRAYDYLKELDQPIGSFAIYRLFYTWGMRWHVFKSWMTGNDFNSLEVLKKFGRRLTLSDEQWLEVNWRWYETLTGYGKVVDGSAAALRELTEMGLKIGLLSNTFVHKSCLEKHMANEGLLEYLPVRMYSYEFPWRKPDVRIFQAAADKIDVAADKIVYVGDRIDNDVNGAAKAGMLPILVRAYTNESKTIPAGVNYIKDHTELVDMIRQQCEIPDQPAETKITQPVCEER